MPSNDDSSNPDVQGRARSWLKLAQVEAMRDACLTDRFPTYLQDRNEGLTRRSLERAVKAIAVEADVTPQLATGGTGEPEDVSPHTLRHSVAYRIVQVEGGRVEDVQLRLRHSMLRTTDAIYSHLIPR